MNGNGGLLMEFIATLAGLLLATQLVAHLCRRVEIPEVIGQILVGIIAGPALLNWVHLNSMMNEFQEIGVIILMFIAGLESDLSLLKKYLKPAVVVAIVGVVVRSEEHTSELQSRFDLVCRLLLEKNK